MQTFNTYNQANEHVILDENGQRPSLLRETFINNNTRAVHGASALSRYVLFFLMFRYAKKSSPINLLMWLFLWEGSLLIVMLLANAANIMPTDVLGSFKSLGVIGLIPTVIFIAFLAFAFYSCLGLTLMIIISLPFAILRTVSNIYHRRPISYNSWAEQRKNMSVQDQVRDFFHLTDEEKLHIINKQSFIRLIDACSKDEFISYYGRDGLMRGPNAVRNDALAGRGFFADKVPWGDGRSYTHKQHMRHEYREFFSL